MGACIYHKQMHSIDCCQTAANHFVLKKSAVSKVMINVSEASDAAPLPEISMSSFTLCSLAAPRLRKGLDVTCITVQCLASGSHVRAVGL